jgi:hypothetical protein
MCANMLNAEETLLMVLRLGTVNLNWLCRCSCLVVSLHCAQTVVAHLFIE